MLIAVNWSWFQYELVWRGLWGFLVSGFNNFSPRVSGFTLNNMGSRVLGCVVDCYYVVRNSYLVRLLKSRSPWVHVVIKVRVPSLKKKLKKSCRQSWSYRKWLKISEEKLFSKDFRCAISDFGFYACRFCFPFFCSVFLGLGTLQGPLLKLQHE